MFAIRIVCHTSYVISMTFSTNLVDLTQMKKLIFIPFGIKIII